MSSYTVYYQTPTDYRQTRFASDYRAGSRQNRSDAQRALSKLGKLASGYKIIKIKRKNGRAGKCGKLYLIYSAAGFKLPMFAGDINEVSAFLGSTPDATRTSINRHHRNPRLNAYVIDPERSYVDHDEIAQNTKGDIK